MKPVEYSYVLSQLAGFYSFWDDGYLYDCSRPPLNLKTNDPHRLYL